MSEEERDIVEEADVHSEEEEEEEEDDEEEEINVEEKTKAPEIVRKPMVYSKVVSIRELATNPNSGLTKHTSEHFYSDHHKLTKPEDLNQVTLKIDSTGHVMNDLGAGLAVDIVDTESGKVLEPIDGGVFLPETGERCAMYIAPKQNGKVKTQTIFTTQTKEDFLSRWKKRFENYDKSNVATKGVGECLNPEQRGEYVKDVDGDHPVVNRLADMSKDVQHQFMAQIKKCEDDNIKNPSIKMSKDLFAKGLEYVLDDLDKMRGVSMNNIGVRVRLANPAAAEKKYEVKFDGPIDKRTMAEAQQEFSFSLVHQIVR